MTVPSTLSISLVYHLTTYKILSHGSNHLIFTKPQVSLPPYTDKETPQGN